MFLFSDVDTKNQIEIEIEIEMVEMDKTMLKGMEDERGKKEGGEFLDVRKGKTFQVNE